jgi:hypothetical protein
MCHQPEISLGNFTFFDVPFKKYRAVMAVKPQTFQAVLLICGWQQSRWEGK